jgi:peptidyl-prolyl cis-trans isomerase D
MGMMTKMRDNAHVFIIAFAVVFIAFWVVSDVDLPSVLGGSRNEIANIGGKSITYQEFQAVVDRVAEQRREQNGGKELTDNDYIQIREQVWNDFLTQAVLDQATEDFGVSVSDQEITDWVWGADPPKDLAQYFVDSTGQFNRDAYESFLRNPGPENREALISLEQQLKAQLLREKLTNILTSSVVVSEEQLRSNFVEQNIDFVASYLFFDPNVFAASDTTAPSDAEYEAYYDKYKNRFKTDAMRKMKYVLFQDVPSKSDTTAIVNELDTFRDLVEKGTDFLELVKSNSEEQFDSSRWFSREQVSPQAASAVFDLPVGAIAGPVASETGLSLYKVISERQAADPLSRASHILFRTDGGQDDAEQKAKADAALAKARSGQDFAKLAAELSEEPGAAERGGDLSWFSKGRMVPEFDAAVLKAKVGDIVGPLKTQFGWHVIKVTGRSSRELQLAEIRLTIRASSRTRDELFDKARDFGYFAGENGFENEAETDGYLVQETPEFSEMSGSFIPGIGTNPALMKFAFSNSVGDISEVHRTGTGYVVAVITEKRKEGYKPLEELKEQLRPQVVFERQMNKTLEQAKRIAASAGSFEQIVASNPKVSLTQTPPFRLQNGAPNIGPDQNFIGTLLRLKQGEKSKPFKGMRGVFVLRLDSRPQLDETAFKVKKPELRQTVLQQLQNEFVQAWLDQKKKEISITDNRDLFYR